jgi:hypothetical protein
MHGTAVQKLSAPYLLFPCNFPDAQEVSRLEFRGKFLQNNSPRVSYVAWLYDISAATEEACGKPMVPCNRVLTFSSRVLFSFSSLDATLLDREANRSLTTDTMCQNLFDPIRVFEREWVFELF